MNLKDLEYLITLSETRHFSQAAQMMHVSQPTLSGQIRKLEQTLAVTLFERDSRNVALTPAGQEITAEARLIMAHVQAIRDIAQAHRDPLAGDLHLGVIASLSPFLTPELLQDIRQCAPGLNIILHEGMTAELLDQLRNRTIDAAIIATPPEDSQMNDSPLFKEPFFLACAKNHPLAANEKIALEDIASEHLLLLDEGHCLRDQIMSLCKTPAADARVRATSLTTIARLIEKGEGITLIPALAAPAFPWLCLRPLRQKAAYREIRMVSRLQFPRKQALDIIASSARKVSFASLR